ncbi:MAG: lysylphosphatidylglycerol synthase transmembrane domain-containing protein [Anaerolineaceae bacterium]
MDKKKIFSIFKWLWLVLVLAAAGYYFYRNWEQVINLISQISAWRIVLSLVLLIIGKMFLVLLVQYSVNSEDWHPKYIETLGIYGLSSLGKYIPGGIWQFVGRFGVYKVNGLSSKASTRAMILENIWLLGSAVAIGVIGVFLTRFDLIAGLLNLPNNQWLAILFTILALGLWIVVLKIVHKTMRRHTAENIPSIFVVAGVGLLLWTFIGGSFFVMFHDFPFSAAPLFIGGYAVSWAVGYIAVFAPGGLGVREAALAFVFSNIASVEMIAVYAAMNRIIWVIAEVLFGLVGMVQKQGMQANQPEDENITLENEETKKQLKEPSLASDSQDMIEGK